VLVKVSPDLSDNDLLGAVGAALEGGARGVVATNTTVSRPADLRGKHARESGGLSGAPLRSRASDVCRLLFRRYGDRVPIIGVGGISNGRDAYDRICSGATLLQIYTAFIYEGPGVVGQINKDLLRYMERDGLKSISDAVGRNA
jgi:dihydroorotate dehydrogenase